MSVNCDITIHLCRIVQQYLVYCYSWWAVMVELCVSVMNISTNDFHWYVNTQQIAWTKYIYIVYIVYPYNRSNVTESPVRLYWPFLVTIYKIEPLLCCLSREKHYRNTISFYMIEMKHFTRLKWNISKCCREIFSSFAGCVDTAKTVLCLCCFSQRLW